MRRALCRPGEKEVVSMGEPRPLADTPLPLKTRPSPGHTLLGHALPHGPTLPPSDSSPWWGILLFPHCFPPGWGDTRLAPLPVSPSSLQTPPTGNGVTRKGFLEGVACLMTRLITSSKVSVDQRGVRRYCPFLGSPRESAPRPVFPLSSLTGSLWLRPFACPLLLQLCGFFFVFFFF